MTRPRVEGVLFIPNALFNFQGAQSLAQAQNAQFISRRLNLSGQGDLLMMPNPNDGISIPEPVFSLIR